MFSIFVLKFLTFFLRTFTRSSGTALPGLLLEKYFPKTLRKLLSSFEQVIFITGTNGKTTTSRMLCHLLEKNNIDFVSNSSGSNLIRGIASVLIDKSSLNGKIKGKLAVFEVEEATMPRLVKLVKPNIVIVTNIFRDQLDAYGEIDKTYRHIRNAIEESNNPHLILNLNDERVSSLQKFTNNHVDFISFNQKFLKYIKFENKGSIKLEVMSNKSKVYEINYIDNNKQGLGTHFQVFDDEKSLLNFNIQVPGMHNTYNAMAAELGFASLFAQDLVEIHESKKFDLDLITFEPAFGRGESIKLRIKNKELKADTELEFQVLLVKNPAGMNLNLELVKNINKDEAILFLLNDRIADGRDVSWIWDCNFELIKDINAKQIFVSGSRKYDMALRIAYELNLKENQFKHNIYDSIKIAIDKISEKSFKKIYVLPTYTAMREFREEMSELTEVKKIYM